MPILVLLGAGASFGSVISGDSRPPLGVGLFDILAERGGVASKVSEAIAQTFRSNFEEGMAKFCEESPGEIQCFQRELAQYLAGFVPLGDNLYLELIRAFAQENVIYASLNYDLMLEQCVEMMGGSYKYDRQREYGKFRILKPHGSSNFWHDEKAITFRGGFKIIAPPGVAAFSAPIIPLSREESLKRCQVDSMSPAMSLYAKGKFVNSCPEFVLRQQSEFAVTCRHVSQIFIFGVRVVTDDDHIWGALSKSAAKITYFGSKNDREELMRWVDHAQRRNVEFVEGFFEESLKYVRSMTDW